MEGLINKWGHLKIGKGQLQVCFEEDTIGFELFEWDDCEDQQIKSCVHREQIPVIESEMTTDTCMWDSKPKSKPKKAIKKERKRDKKSKQQSVKVKNSDLITQLKMDYQSLTKSQSQDLKLLQFDDYAIFADDIFNLQYDEWLSDSNISLFYSLIRHSFISSYKTICLLPPTFAFLLANIADPLELKDVMPKDLHEAQVIFCPVNDNIDFDDVQGGSHWSLLICLPKLGVSLGVDSMESANDTEMKRLNTQLGILMKKRLEYKELKTPQQINGSDCGVIVIAITMIYLHRILILQDDEIVNWSLDNLRINPLGCRFWMMRTLKSLINKYENGVQFKY